MEWGCLRINISVLYQSTTSSSVTIFDCTVGWFRGRLFTSPRGYVEREIEREIHPSLLIECFFFFILGNSKSYVPSFSAVAAVSPIVFGASIINTLLTHIRVEWKPYRFWSVRPPIILHTSVWIYQPVHWLWKLWVENSLCGCENPRGNSINFGI